MIQRFFARPFARPFARLGLWRTSAVCAAMVSVSSTLAIAQDDLRPPKSDQALSAPTIMTIVVAVLLTGAVVFVATRKSKRTHQD